MSVTRKMLVESDPHQTRVAVLENDALTEIYVERKHDLGVVGNIYKGRVNRVLPGMQAAFVDIGLERDAFLYVSDVGGQAETDDTVRISLAELNLERDEGSKTPSGEVSIADLLREGQEVLVQVTKDALPNKGARVTTHLTLPSRHLVLLPSVTHLGISRRIEGEDERHRLHTMLDALRRPGEGLIVRTVAEGQGEEELGRDLTYLHRLWERVHESAAKVGPPTLIHRELDIALRVVRDEFNSDFSVLWVDGEDAYERIVDFLDLVQPSLVGRVKLDHQESGLFDRFGVESEIESALQSKVWLKSGGHLFIDQTEALVSIDVNTGRFVGKRDLEDTVLRTNLEAVGEIVRQIRLRDLSGILIIDFIDMTEVQHREEVHRALEQELTRDRAKSKLSSISEFGLVQVTRKRSHSNLERLMTQPCPYCRGRGRIKALGTICLALRREVLERASRGRVREILVRVHPQVAQALQTEERAILDEFDQAFASTILLQSDPSLHHEKFSVTDA